ncbi:ABC transporter ATP-binding protein [Microbacteriaceae bacterium VKM Ac-2854]|nr:ABC transporter ATP-binding protein [Microbacteriaceae bacterium VKM Ac-2854]
MDRVLDVFNITKRYGEVAAIDNFSLTVERGQIHGLLGPNGSGKTTSLHIVTGLLRADSGTVTICGEPIESKKSRAYMGFAPDDLPLPGSLTGREYLAFHDAMRSRHDRLRAAELIRALGLGKDLNKQIAQYSHGMKRKVQVIAALVHQPDVLILDEPFRGLDPDAAAVLRSLIVSFARSGRAVLIATHDLLRAERDCDQVTILSKGATVATGSPQALVLGCKAAENLEDVFLTVTGLRSDNLFRQESIELLFTRDDAGASEER